MFSPVPYAFFTPLVRGGAETKFKNCAVCLRYNLGMETQPKPDITDEERAAMMAWIAAHPYGDQDENGVDLSTLRYNLRLTPTERRIRLQQAAHSISKIRRINDTNQR